ncbi:unnamed protein product [Lupinus luteus]|uniref:Uncharacterized protein n=1 Tax=Lupinus luteus TaxID=3873 RepID=A0AAV1Y2A4_LUPLU
MGKGKYLGSVGNVLKLTVLVVFVLDHVASIDPSTLSFAVSTWPDASWSSST